MMITVHEIRHLSQTPDSQRPTASTHAQAHSRRQALAEPVPRRRLQIDRHLERNPGQCEAQGHRQGYRPQARGSATAATCIADASDGPTIRATAQRGRTATRSIGAAGVALNTPRCQPA